MGRGIAFAILFCITLGACSPCHSADQDLSKENYEHYKRFYEAYFNRQYFEREFIESLDDPQDRRKGWLWLIKHQDDIYKHFVQEWVTNSEAKAFSNLLNSFRNINLLFENVYRGYSSMSKEESKEIAELYEYAKSSERAVLYLDLLSFILGDNSKRSVIIEILETRHADQDWVLRSRSLMALYVRKDKSFIPYAFKMLKDDTRFETLSTITYKKCWRYPARNAAESFMRALGYSIDHSTR